MVQKKASLRLAFFKTAFLYCAFKRCCLSSVSTVFEHVESILRTIKSIFEEIEVMLFILGFKRDSVEQQLLLELEIGNQGAVNSVCPKTEPSLCYEDQLIVCYT